MIDRLRTTHFHARPERLARLEHLKDKLLDERRRVLADLSKGLNTAVDAACGNQADQTDVASSTRDQETGYEIGVVEARVLSQIDEALDRLATGTYGICDDCRKRIPGARLEAIPFASLCVPCKESEEREQGPIQERADGLEEMLDALGELEAGSVKEYNAHIRGRRVG